MTDWIASAPLSVFLGILAMPSALIAIGGIVGLRAARIARTIARMQTTPLGSAEPGYVELEGKIEAGEGGVLAARLTRAEVAWFRAKVEEFVPASRSDAGQSTWRIVVDEVSRAPFVIRDATGACAVLPDGAEVTPTDRSVWYGATPEPTERNPPRVGPGEGAEGLLRVATTGAHRYRYTEERIYVGDPLYALGELQVEPDLDEDEDEDEGGGEEKRGVQPGALRLGAPLASSQPFVLSTTPQDELASAERVGSQAALGIAGIGVLVFVMLIWIRVG